MARIKPFTLLNSIQFLAAINENLYKLLAAFFLIHELGKHQTSLIMSIVGVVFTLPFLLFSSLGGYFADKWPKSRIVIGTRALEFSCLIVALFIFGFHLSYGAYVILFFMASFSAIFGPTKYGLIPELVNPKRILYGNSVIAAFTYLGIIIGTSLASFIIYITHYNFVLAVLSSVLVALIGLIMSFFLPMTAAENAEKPFRIFIYIELWDTLKQIRKIPSLFSATMAYAYLLFIGAFVQLNIIPYTIKNLGLSAVAGGYLFLVSAFGLGLGAILTNRISKGKIRLGMIPFSGVGISIALILMKWFYAPWYLFIIWLALLGLFGGMFLVPPQAYILAASPKEDRGRNFATANFLSFTFVLLAAVALYVLNTLLRFSPASSFFIVGIINLGVMLCFIKRK